MHRALKRERLLLSLRARRGAGERASSTYTVTVRDAMSHQSSVGFAVIHDATPPTLTLAALMQGTDVHATWSADDSGSGVGAGTCRLEVQGDEGAWQPFSTECVGDDTYEGQPDHTYTFRLSAADNVGNADSLEAEAVVPYAKKYYYANGQRVAMREGDVVYYIHTDHLGSVSLVTDHVSEAVARQVYYPYGTPRWSEGTLPTEGTVGTPYPTHWPAQRGRPGLDALRGAVLLPAAGAVRQRG